jgi:hypothetical protein
MTHGGVVGAGETVTHGRETWDWSESKEKRKRRKKGKF